jgi:tetratricopeptide (TPR) repeat protein
MVGSLMKLEERIKLSLNIYGDRGDTVVWTKKYTEQSGKLFEILSEAAEDAAATLAKQTDSAPIQVEEQLRADVSAYDFYLKGKSYYQTNKPEDLEFAISMFNKAVEIEPAFALAHAGLSDVYAFQYMAYYDRTLERITQSQTEALKAIELDPRLPDAHRSLARYYMFTGNAKKAEECLLTATGLNPKYALGYRTLAWLKAGQGNYESATEWAGKALELAPTDLETMLLLGLISMNQQKLTVAMATLQRAVELGPDYGRAYYNLGQVYLKLGVLDLALENYLLAIKYKGDPNCYIDCGYVYLIKRDYQAARGQFEESVKSGYFPFVAEYYLGLTELVRGNREEALAYFMKAFELTKKLDFQKPENIKVMAYHALALAGLNDRENSLATLQVLEARSDLDGEVLYNIARCRMLLGDEREAQETLCKAVTRPSGPTEKEIAFDPLFSNKELTPEGGT